MQELKKYSTEKLIELWEKTEEAEYSLELATVRGWLMEEIEIRNPIGFNRWLELDAPEDKDLRNYILE